MARPRTDPETRRLRRELEQANLERDVAEARYTTTLLAELTEQQSIFGDRLEDPDERNWAVVSQHGSLVSAKDFQALRDAATIRRESYRLWRTNAHARGILRSYCKFIIGRDFGIDFLDQQRGVWNADRTRLVPTSSPDDPLLVREAWEEFAVRERFGWRAKEMVLRTFRDGEVFLRRFSADGRVSVRFVEPDQVQGQTAGHVAPGDGFEAFVGKPTTVRDGIEYLAHDVETVVAYHLGDERVPAADMLHVKCLADSNDLRGFPLLEVVQKNIANYTQWEDYRMVLNKVRSAVALVRKVEGTSQQASALIAGRASARAHPEGMEPQTASGRREAMFKPGTVLTPGANVSYDFLSPRLDARDAGEDGRRFLLSIAAGVGLPEMLVTGDFSNANLASLQEAISVAVREFEDWQDYFGMAFERIIDWVLTAAIEAVGLPEDVNRGVVLHWPTMIRRDALKETQRHQVLWEAGLLSRTTWAGKEDLIWDDEVEHMRTEEDATGASTNGAGGSESGAEVQTEALLAMSELEEALDKTDDPVVREALSRYIEAAKRLATVSWVRRR